MRRFSILPQSKKWSLSATSEMDFMEIVPSTIQFGRKDFFNTGKDGALLLSFRHLDASAIQQSILQHFVDEFHCASVAILNIDTTPLQSEFSVYVLKDKSHATILNKDAKYQTNMFAGLLETLSKPMEPTIYDHICETWKKIFQFTPTCLILVPARFPMENYGLGTQPRRRWKSVIRNTIRNFYTISTVTVLAFKEANLPEIFLQEQTWIILLSACRLNAPLLVNADKYEKTLKDAKHFSSVFDAVTKVETEIQDLRNCINAIGIELKALFSAENVIVFFLQDGPYEPYLVKYEIIGAEKESHHCPHKHSHKESEVLITTKFPAGWSALNKKSVRINSLIQLDHICGENNGPLHSVVHCLVSNMMCIYLENQTKDLPLVIELTNKPGGFTQQDENDAKLFTLMIRPILTTANLLEYRRNSIRRSEITNKVLSNITKVKFTKVKQLLDFKFQYSSSFNKRFNTIHFSFSEITKDQYFGVILHMFNELNFMKRWKIRKSTLIRFILSLKQGYNQNPYHNFNHACTVTHFAFYLLKKMQLQKNGFLKDIEAFSLVIACICHDVSHSGVNNHFSVFANQDTHHIYAQEEESLMERHHVAVALQILSTDDCNIAENLNDVEYKEFVELVQWNIIATDLGKYLMERVEMFALMKKFNKKKKEHRKVLLSLLMTTCDLCETIKPWDDYIMTVKNIFFEFFQQGDEERNLGYKPTPIMDRKIAYIPYIELKFVNEIVRPVYEMLAKTFTKLHECLELIDHYKDLWIVASTVFDNNVHLQNPLDVLDLPELMEVNLKAKGKQYELEKEATKIRETEHTQAVTSQSTEHLNLIHSRPTAPPPEDRSDVYSLESGESGSLHKRGFNVSYEEDEVKGSRLKRCSNAVKELCCCYKCRQAALYAAQYIRKTNHETQYMEIRSEEYEKSRIDEFYDGEYIDEKKPRDRIQSLINPKFSQA